VAPRSLCPSLDKLSGDGHTAFMVERPLRAKVKAVERPAPTVLLAMACGLFAFLLVVILIVPR
jgi:hypothetical protein